MIGPDPTLFEKIYPRLPIFRIDQTRHSVVYTPSHFVVVTIDEAEAISRAWQSGTRLRQQSVAGEAAAWIYKKAIERQEKYRRWQQDGFSPDCLTIYPSNCCNMRCIYCYAAGSRPDRLKTPQASRPIVDIEVVAAAAQIVAATCRRRNRPFRLIMHGGGEPTLHWHLLQKIVRTTRTIAEQHQVDWLGHIATNGMLTKEQAVWIGHHFGSVGLSCDGPPDIQNHQRPLPSNGLSSEFIVRAAESIQSSRARLTVRATITPATIHRQEEIVAYVHSQLGVRQIRFEPGYRLDGKPLDGFSPSHADVFVDHFIRAQGKARQLGGELSYSGVRPHEIHGPYCSLLRNVLHLLPNGLMTACFFSMEISKGSDRLPVVGHLDKAAGGFVFGQGRIARHRQQASHAPAVCRDCVNVWNCTHGCPDRCVVSMHEKKAPEMRTMQTAITGAEFRCRVNQRLVRKWILAAADQLADRSAELTSVSSIGNDTNLVNQFLKPAPPSIDTDDIYRNYIQIKDAYKIRSRKMPVPLWGQRSYDHTGKTAWNHLKSHILQSFSSSPMSVYVHVPFCDRHCGFCDCLSFRLKKVNAAIQQRFSDTIKQELINLSSIAPIRMRPVTTVHFGGGTPSYLESNVFGKMIKDLTDHLAIGRQTEWAIESTANMLSNEKLSHLKKSGVTRLHVGVQTLNDHERKCLGRKLESRELLKRLERAMLSGFVTSADLIYGIPGQRMESFLGTLTTLVELGIHGISLYRLNRSKRNARFFKRGTAVESNALADWTMFQVADQFLLQKGYAKNHFCHYALWQDKNLYSNHARRGEDLLAFGPSADGCLGDYFYRHQTTYSAYVKGVSRNYTMLEGGLEQTSAEKKAHALQSGLLCSHLEKKRFLDLNLEPLLDRWIDYGLIVEKDKDHVFSLSANGSWFVDKMINEVAERVARYS